MIATLMGGEQAAMVITDPPYNVPIKGHVSGKGRTRHTEFAMASGEMSENPPVAWYRSVREINQQMEDTAQLFLGQRLACAK